MNAAMDATSRLLVGQLPEAGEVARYAGKAHGSGPGNRERHIVTTERQLQRPGGRRREARRIARVGRIGRRRQKWSPRGIRGGIGIEILLGSLDRRARSPRLLRRPAAATVTWRQTRT
jgi:hypothetical protein